MINWENVYQRLMTDFKGLRLIPHLAILGGAFVLGIFMGFYFNNNLMLVILVWVAGGLADYWAYGTEILELMAKDRPYTIRGVITNRTQKIISEGPEEYDQFWFELNIQEAYALSRKGKDREHFYEKEGLQLIEVPESMFLSLKVGQEIALVCEPDDYAWGLVRDDEVIKIDA